MRCKRPVVVLILLYMLLLPCSAAAEQVGAQGGGIGEKIVPELDMNEINRYIGQLDSEIKRLPRKLTSNNWSIR